MRLIDADALDYELGTSDRDIYVRECLAEAPSVTPEPNWIPVTKEEMFKAGYDGREIIFKVDGRLFAMRELAQ
jgi:uncharacterized protein YdhG (YjbR/CyaY superfamily)